MTVSGNAGSEPGERRILVLGADGFIGRRVVAALAESGWARPIAAGRRAGATSDGIERRVFDATDAIELADAMRDADGVVSCIAGSATTIVDSARALFWPVPGIAPPRIVYLSSMAVYGSAVGDVAEDAPLLGDVGPYSAAKVIAEGLAADTPETVVLRPGCVYGPDSPQWSVRVARWLEDRRIGDLGSAGDGLCNLIHVDDVARAVLLALRAPRAAGQAYNLSLDQPPTWNDYFVAFAKALRAVPVQRISRRRLAIETKLFAPPLKIAEILGRRFGGGARELPPPIPPSLLGLWRQEIRLTMDKTREELDLTVRPLEEGLRETAAALRSV